MRVFTWKEKENVVRFCISNRLVNYFWERENMAENCRRNIFRVVSVDRLNYEGNYRNRYRDGSWAEYYESGKNKEKYNYENGETDGQRIEYYR